MSSAVGSVSKRKKRKKRNASKEVTKKTSKPRKSKPAKKKKKRRLLQIRFIHELSIEPEDVTLLPDGSVRIVGDSATPREVSYEHWDIDGYTRVEEYEYRGNIAGHSISRSRLLEPLSEAVSVISVL